MAFLVDMAAYSVVGADIPVLPYFGTQAQVLSWQGSCTAKHPTFGVACQMQGHPHRVSHFCRGVTDDGQMWHMHWWSPRAQHEAPDLKADQVPVYADQRI